MRKLSVLLVFGILLSACKKNDDKTISDISKTKSDTIQTKSVTSTETGLSELLLEQFSKNKNEVVLKLSLIHI